jgi:ATP-dependent protease ClpP protease subunit
MVKRSHELMWKADNTEISWGFDNGDRTIDGEKSSKRAKSHKAHNPNTDNSIYTVGNEIHFSCGIDKNSIQEVIRQMTELITEHKKKSDDGEKLVLTYIVDSPGGSVTSVLKFVDFVELAKSKYHFVEFVSIISGMVASAGTIMAMVADKRYMTKNAHAMIHELTAGNQSKLTFLRSYMAYLNLLHDRLVDVYCSKTKKTKEEIEDLLKNETWFSAQEYLNNGFVDAIK